MAVQERWDHHHTWQISCNAEINNQCMRLSCTCTCISTWFLSLRFTFDFIAPIPKLKMMKMRNTKQKGTRFVWVHHRNYVYLCAGGLRTHWNELWRHLKWVRAMFESICIHFDNNSVQTLDKRSYDSSWAVISLSGTAIPCCDDKWVLDLLYSDEFIHVPHSVFAINSLILIPNVLITYNAPQIFIESWLSHIDVWSIMYVQIWR